MVQIERLEEKHVSDVLEIYNYYVKNSTATFSVEPIDEEEMRHIVFSGIERFPSYVIQEEGNLLGYALLNRYKAREAYDRTAEVTIYLKDGCQGKHIGSKALEYIENQAEKDGFRALLAVVCAENDESIHLFKKFGYFQCANFKQVGEKFDRVLDVVIYEKLLQTNQGK